MKNVTKKAMGNREGDYLHLSNKFANISILKESNYPSKYTVYGDCTSLQFITFSAALDYAVKELVRFVEGRGD